MSRPSLSEHLVRLAAAAEDDAQLALEAEAARERERQRWWLATRFDVDRCDVYETDRHWAEEAFAWPRRPAFAGPGDYRVKNAARWAVDDLTLLRGQVLLSTRTAYTYPMKWWLALPYHNRPDERVNGERPGRALWVPLGGDDLTPAAVQRNAGDALLSDRYGYLWDYVPADAADWLTSDQEAATVGADRLEGAS